MALKPSAMLKGRVGKKISTTYARQMHIEGFVSSHLQASDFQLFQRQTLLQMQAVLMRSAASHSQCGQEDEYQVAELRGISHFKTST